MIDVEEAKTLVVENCTSLGGMSIQLKDAMGYILNQDVLSPIQMPPFNQSAMDGYAIGSYKDEVAHSNFILIGEVRAGDAQIVNLKAGEAVRIFTGGMVPIGAMAVIMQESTSRKGNEVIIEQEINAGSNIRPEGEQIKIDEVALPKNTKLTPAGIGFLAGLGITEVQVYQQPKIGILITGSELVEAGNTLAPGQIYESNSITLITALKESGYHNIQWLKVEDDFKKTQEAIQSLSAQVDLMMVSGGISVGDYDFVGAALEKNGVETIFHKIKQKPGKPLYFGKSSDCSFFGLPGNPAAALSCFYQYVLPAIRIMSGHEEPFLQLRMIPLVGRYKKKGNRANFLKAKVDNYSVEILEGQSSAMLHTFAVANAQVFIPADVNELRPGELVQVHFLP
jgi:molybdopterin molybdotransferase